MRYLIVIVAVLVGLGVPVRAQDEDPYLVLATRRTGTMQDELSEAAARGYVLVGMFGGETALGGAETVAIMRYEPQGPRMEYELLATNLTGTLEDELNTAAARGFSFRDIVVFRTMFGGNELVAILERDARER